MKKCTTCGKEKEPKEFAKDKRAKDGLDARCKKCAIARKNKYQPLVTGQVRPRQKTRKDTLRQQLIVKHGLAVVEAMEAIGDC
jgi:hypothetical protein